MTIFYEFLLLELDAQLQEMAGTKDTCHQPRGYFHIKRSGGLDLTSSLEAKFGARSSQVRQ